MKLLLEDKIFDVINMNKQTNKLNFWTQLKFEKISLTEFVFESCSISS